MENVEDIRGRRQGENVRFLQKLTPHLRAARSVERELDHQLARRFKVFRYLRDDELGLSRIIADLLDPVAEHGQGTIFLGAMLELLPEVPVDRLGSTAAAKIRVEREITERRRIDITVDIPAEGGTFCLAFENKPYADDQHRQCRDYLEFLNNEYDGRFLLVYLPPRYRMPDESSLPLPDRKRWKNHFFVLPYCHDDAPPDADDPSGLDGETLAQDASGGDDADTLAADGPSLADWFGNCHAICDAARLRWFLQEGQLYCRQQFGDSTMTDTEAAYIRDYLEKNPEHLPAAYAVARAWPAVKHDVCRRFLEHLRGRVEKELQQACTAFDDLDIGCHYGEDKQYASYLRVYRKGWVRYEDPSGPKSDGRTTVMLECGQRGPTWWCWGVRVAKNKDEMTDTAKKRYEEVDSALKKRGLSLPKSSSWWPQWAETRHTNWSAIVPELVQELDKGGGRITDYYVNGLLDIAKKAIPAIDEVEREISA
ncbi:MAG: hypothetical protein F4X96_05825 [Gammaproteobacteria bacterium]|nr:hypothetical protein [Gammaproteobacteria bacterium]